jgi:hypothetical protein
MHICYPQNLLWLATNDLSNNSRTDIVIFHSFHTATPSANNAFYHSKSVRYK